MIISSLVSTAIVFSTIGGGTVNPVTASSECSMKSVGFNTLVSEGSTNTVGSDSSRFALNSDGTVTAKFKVVGNDDCKQVVTLATWKAPDADKGLPYSEQKLYKHVSGTFAPGVHTMTVALPNCFYQVDLVRGAEPTDQNGGPQYGSERMAGSLHGGTQACTDEKTEDVLSTEVVSPTELPKTGLGSGFAYLLGAIMAATAASLQYLRQARRA